MRRQAPALTIAAWLAACGGPDAGTASAFGIGGGPGGASGPAGETSSSSSSSAAASSMGTVPEDSSTTAAAASDATGPLLDVGGADFGGGEQPAGCKGKIDILFVISRGSAMEWIQDRLIDAFPKFIATIESKFDDFDYHIMVVDGDPYWGWPICTADCPGLMCKVGEPCCPVMPHCVNGECVKIGDPCCRIDDYPCDLVPELTACDETLGAGTLFNGGDQASNKICGVVDGRRYLTREQPDLVGTFACLAQVGLSGDVQIGAALTAALSPELNAPGGCNEGFLRDDALLMVAILYASIDQSSPGKPKLWADAVIEAKHGDPNAVVMFGLTQPPCTPVDRVCKLLQHYFPYSYVGDNRDDDYAPAFEAAADKVLEACTQFIPK